PQISVTGLKVRDSDSTHPDFKLYLRIDNPNSFSLSLNGFTYQLKVNNVEWASDYTTEEMTVPKNESNYISVPIFLYRIKTDLTVEDVLENRSDLHYSLKGNVDITAEQPLLGDTEFSFSDEGSLPLMME